MFDQTRDTTFFEVLNPAATERLPHDRTPKHFRVLLVYPNYSMVNLLPTRAYAGPPAAAKQATEDITS